MRIDPVEEIKKNPFVLAPMAGITDSAFRSFAKQMGASVVITELVSAKGLEYASERTKKLAEFREDQRCIGVQVFGEDVESLGQSAAWVEDQGADFVDLNLGCPVPKVVKKGGGSAMLKDLPMLRKVLREMKKSTSIPVTIKIRTGWDQASLNADEVAQLAYDEGISWVAIHGRTRAQGYRGLADWDYIKKIKENAPLPILGNGDIVNSSLAVSKLREFGCDGVMIGRGCLKNPKIFAEARYELSKEKIKALDYTTKEVLELLWQNIQEQTNERIKELQFKKFASWFSAGYPNSAQFRKEMFQSQKSGNLLQTVLDYYDSIQDIMQKDTSDQPFLMGGHG